MSTVISVAICTYNRGELLGRALESLFNQSFPKSKFEIIVIDDGSTDDTKTIVQTFKHKHKELSITYCKNNNTGLAASRNKAVNLSHSEYIAYLDDDAYAHKEWLKEAYSCILSIKPTPHALTGPIYPYYKVKKPEWFKDRYVEDVRGSEGRFLDSKETLSGPNMIIEKKMVKKYGGFDQSVDMKADILMLGEETSLFEKIRKDFSKALLYYSPNVIVYHLTHPYKMEVNYLLKRWFASGQSYYLRNKRDGFLSKLKRSIKVYSYFLFSAVTAFMYFLGYKYKQNWAVERIGPILFSIGFLCSAFGLNVYMKSENRE